MSWIHNIYFHFASFCSWGWGVFLQTCPCWLNLLFIILQWRHFVLLWVMSIYLAILLLFLGADILCNWLCFGCFYIFFYCTQSEQNLFTCVCSNISRTGSVSIYLEDMPVLVFDETECWQHERCLLHYPTGLDWKKKSCVFYLRPPERVVLQLLQFSLKNVDGVQIYLNHWQCQNLIAG